MTRCSRSTNCFPIWFPRPARRNNPSPPRDSRLLLLISSLLVQPQRGGINTETQASRSGAVVENVPQMSVAAAAEDLGARHSMALVVFHFDVLRGNRLKKAWPAGAGVKFGVGTEEWLAATDARISSFVFRFFVFAGEGRFGSLLARDEILFVG